MTETEVLRLIGEVSGLLAAVGVGLRWLGQQVWKVHRAVEVNTEQTAKLTAQLTIMNGSVKDHAALDNERFGDIAERLANIEGRLGLPPREGGAAR